MKVISELKETSYIKSENFVSESRRPASDRFNPYVAQEQSGIPNIKEALREINSDIGNVVKQELTSLQLSTSLALLIENNLMANMNYDLAKKIGNAISAALFHKDPITMKDLQEMLAKNKIRQDQSYLIEKLENKITTLEENNKKNVFKIKENHEEIEVEIFSTFDETFNYRNMERRR